jgi:hypothetical protein
MHALMQDETVRLTNQMDSALFAAACRPAVVAPSPSAALIPGPIANTHHPALPPVLASAPCLLSDVEVTAG